MLFCYLYELDCNEVYTTASLWNSHYIWSPVDRCTKQKGQTKICNTVFHKANAQVLKLDTPKWHFGELLPQQQKCHYFPLTILRNDSMKQGWWTNRNYCQNTKVVFLKEWKINKYGKKSSYLVVLKPQIIFDTGDDFID